MFVAAFCLKGCSGSSGPVDGQKAYAHVDFMVKLGPRPSGSAGRDRNVDYLKAEITKAGLKPLEQNWTEEVLVYGARKKINFRNVWTVIPGTKPASVPDAERPVLLIGAHYDSKATTGHPGREDFRFVAAIDGAGASGVLLELARVIPRDFPADIWLVWFDGEESVEWEWTDDPLGPPTDRKALFGSRHFAQTMHADKQRFPRGLSKRMKAMVLLDLIGAANIKIDKDHESNSALLDIFGRAAEKMGEKDRMYKYVSKMTDDHQPFKKLGVPVIDVIDFRWRTPEEAKRRAEDPNAPPEGEYSVWWHTADDDMKNVDASSLAFAGNLVFHALPELEKKYFSK